MKINEKTMSKINRSWLIVALILLVIAAAQLFGTVSISPAIAQETAPDPTPRVEATAMPTPTEPPAFCPLTP